MAHSMGRHFAPQNQPVRNHGNEGEARIRSDRDTTARSRRPRHRPREHGGPRGRCMATGVATTRRVRANSEAASFPDEAASYLSSNPAVLCSSPHGTGLTVRQRLGAGTRQLREKLPDQGSHEQPAQATSLPSRLHAPSAGEKPVEEVTSSRGYFSQGLKLPL